jgi:hypothetical protein
LNILLSQAVVVHLVVQAVEVVLADIALHQDLALALVLHLPSQSVLAVSVGAHGLLAVILLLALVKTLFLVL